MWFIWWLVGDPGTYRVRSGQGWMQVMPCVLAFLVCCHCVRWQVVWTVEEIVV